MAKMLPFCRSVIVAMLAVTSSSIIVAGFKSAMAPARKSFLHMGPINAISSLVRPSDSTEDNI